MSDTDDAREGQGGAIHQEPSQHEQALEAARDGLTRTELTNVLHNLHSVHYVDIDGEDAQWRPTTIHVHLDDDHGSKSGDLLNIMRAAGWKPTHVAFSRNRIDFEERGAE